MTHVPVSISCIHRGDPEPLLRALDSAAGALAHGCGPDYVEIVVVDTGSSRPQRRALAKAFKKLPNARLIERPDLTVDYEPHILRHLTPEHLAEYKAYYGEARGILNFAAARTVALEAATHDYIFWLDSDDILVESEAGELRATIDDHLGERTDCLFLDYDYSFDAEGVCTTRLRRERIFNRYTYEWRGACHETACPRDGARPIGPGFFEDCRAKIIHTEAAKPHRISDIRNFVCLMAEVERADEAGEQTDPRVVYYLGQAARGLELLKLAKHFYERFDGMSGSADDRFGAAFYRGAIALHPKVRRPLEALDCYTHCVQIKPFDPRGYFGIARANAALERHKESMFWYDIGCKLRMPPDQVHAYDPNHVHYHPHIMAAAVAKEMQDAEGAINAMAKAYSFRPNGEAARHLEDLKQWAAGEKLAESILRTIGNMRHGSFAQARRLGAAICKELRAVPDSLERQGIGRQEGPDPRPPRPEIAFYCPGTLHAWGAYSRDTGIGGSEKMVIILAEALQRSGLVNCTVYANVPFDARGIHESGVRWQHFAEIDLARPRQAMIYWRCPEQVPVVTCPAEKRVLWLHDVTPGTRISDEALAILDYVQVQSEYHATFLEGRVPEEKLWISRNATELPAALGRLVRDPKLVVYCSSWDRGLLTACEVVKRARKLDPEIQLVVTYGIGEWARKMWAARDHRHIPDVGRDIGVDVYERELYRALDEVDATVLHKINFKQMEALFRSAGVWLYPTRFAEISCMSAMEAQQNGTAVLATRFGALAETLLPEALALAPPLLDLPEGGPPSDAFLDDGAEKLIAACQIPADDPRRAEVAALATERYRVDTLADQWLDVLGPEKVEAALSKAQARPTCSAAGASSSSPRKENP